MEKLRIFVNASLLRKAACLRWAYWHSVIRYRTKGDSIEAVFGKAVHLFISTYRLTGGDSNAALKAAQEYFSAQKVKVPPKKAWMNFDRLVAACIFWQSHWMAEGDDLITLVTPEQKPIVELKFALPYWQNDTVEIILDGFIDDLCRKGQNGAYCIRDYKTTQAWDAPSYLKEKRLDPQLLFYATVIEEYAKQYPQSIYADMVHTGFGCLIEGIFIKQYGEIKIERSDMFFYDMDTMTGFKNSLNKFVSSLGLWATSNVVPDPEGMLNGSCKWCDFRLVCGAVDKVAGEYVLQNNFQIKPSTTLEEV